MKTNQQKISLWRRKKDMQEYIRKEYEKRASGADALAYKQAVRNVWRRGE